MARFFLLSDLHLTPESTVENTPWVEHFCRFLISQYREVYIFVMGDVITKGDPSAFSAAREIFNYIKEQLSVISYNLFFLPGNHDYCNNKLDDYFEFCKCYQRCGADEFNYSKQKAWNCNVEDFNFILTDSINNAQYSKPGAIDIQSIQKCIISDKTNVRLMHHSLQFEDKFDHTGIINYPDTIEKLEKFGIKYVFHGHAHAERDFSWGRNGKLIGVGPIGEAGNFKNESEQFIEIQTSGKSLESIANWIWRGGKEQYGKSIISFADSKQHTLDLIDNIRCDAPEGYISRYVMSRENASADELARLFTEEKKATLFDVCANNKLVLFIADAGMGKTIEMKQLAHTASTNPSYRSAFIPLNLYNSGTLEDFIDACTNNQYKTIDRNRLFLALDGYDEVQNQEFFRQELTKFIQNYQETHICVSMRSNFLKSNSLTFQDFKPYQLLELSNSDVVNELERRGIEKETFLALCEKKDLFELLIIPFYLFHILDIFCEKRTLPDRSELMPWIVDKLFEQDSVKFDYIHELKDFEYDARPALTKFALGLQLLGCSFIDDKRLFALYKNKLDREYIIHSGMILQAPQGRGFVHNNFKEYLVAKYILQFSADEIIRWVTIPETDAIDPKWYNVLGFVLQEKTDEKMLEWILHSEPLVLAKIEPDRLSAGLRYSVFENVLSTIIEQNIWYPCELCSEEKLAYFSQSEKALTLILKQIDEPSNFRAQHFCLNMVENYTNLFNAEEIVKEKLIACYKRENTRPEEKRIAIRAIAALKLNYKNIDSDLGSLFSECNNSEVRLGIYEYIFYAKCANEHVDVLLDGLLFVSFSLNRTDSINTSEQIMLIDCLKSINDPDAIGKVLQWFSADDNIDVNIYGIDEILSSAINMATGNYINGRAFLFEKVYSFFVSAIRNYQTKYTSKSIAFFTETKTLETALVKFDTECPQDFEHMIDLITGAVPETVNTICDLYQTGIFKNFEVLKNIAQHYQENAEIFEKCADIIQNKTGKALQLASSDENYESRHIKDLQTFFNCLFDKQLLQLLIDQMLNLLDKPELTFDELQEIHIYRIQHLPGWQTLWIALVQQNLGKHKVADFLTLIDWDAFVLGRLHYLFKNENAVEAIKIHDNQMRKLQDICYSMESNLDFSAVYSEKEDRQCNIRRGYLQYETINAAIHREFPTSYYCGLLEIPYFAVRNYSNPEFKYILIEEHLKKEEIIRQIERLSMQENRVYVLSDLMFGCERYRIESCVDVAINICKNNDLLGNERETALSYLAEVFENEVIFDKVMPFVDDDFFRNIVNMFINTRDERIHMEIIKRYSKNQNGDYLKYLIFFNDQIGLQDYIKSAKEKCGIPDRNFGGDGETDAIRAISDISMLPLLADATRLRFTDTFVDGAFSTLYGSLYNAFRNCAKIDYESVKETVENLREELCENLDAKSFCNSLLREIKRSDQMLRIRQWSDAEVKSEIEKIE